MWWMSRGLGRALSIGVLIAVGLAGCGERESADSLENSYQPNILVLVIDCLRADRLGIDGYPLGTSPNLDALASEGLYFKAALAHSTWTKPSIATLFTSLYPSQHGIQRASVGEGADLRTDLLDERLVTLAERLRAGGYTTGAAINQVHLQSRFGFSQGFDFYGESRGRGAFRLNKQIEEWIAGLQHRPFFAYVHYLDLHWPYTLQVKGQTADFGSTRMTSKPPHSGREAPEWGKSLSVDDVAALSARYNHEVAYTDAAAGDLFERLRKLGHYEDTLILVTSDHGEAFMEHGALAHGLPPHEEVLRVPMIVRQPEEMRGKIGLVENPVGLIDVMPTLLDVAGLEAEAGAQGESFRALLRGEPFPERVLFAEGFDSFAVRGKDHKLIWYDDGRREFYDLVVDPGETDSRADPCTGPCREMARLLRPFRRMMLKSRESNPTGTAKLEADEIETLRALGYVD